MLSAQKTAPELPRKQPKGHEMLIHFEKPRHTRWGFLANMGIGDAVQVPASHASGARRAAGARNRNVFPVYEGYFVFADNPEGDGIIITRVAKRPDPNAWWATRKDDPIYMLLVGE